jgi:hypothetical protein
MLLLMARDISDHRRVETSLREAKEQAELANRTKSQFLRLIPLSQVHRLMTDRPSLRCAPS